ncbi:MAG: 1-deoxy-D-xylulose-5-phosphate reductoisomerase [Candidatus Omnitrophica bacterium]|nr:1-deoxy-D-xylulose-5-phosphate reductoisomerase [Candidatus Omnitrophota bacterium]
MKNVVIFGSTGSIGTSTLDVISPQRKDFRVFGLVANLQKEVLKNQIEKWTPQYVVLPEADKKLQGIFPHVKFLLGYEGMEEIAVMPQVDIIVMAIPGLVGLKSTLKALQSNKKVALATKEIIVSAGPLLKKYGHNIIPVDSEHNAIFQIISEGKKHIKKIFITASGGPLLKYKGNFENVTLKQILKHPVWNMGKKVTVDSATLMNKGLELIEASFLFGMEPKQMDVLVHPQAIVHGLVLFTDGFMKAVLSIPDMKYSINYCLNYPERKDIELDCLNLSEIGHLTFQKPDVKHFPCLALAKQTLKKGGSFLPVLNTADEEVVKLFLYGKICFSRIPEIIEKVLEKHKPVEINKIEDIYQVEKWTKQQIAGLT